MTGYNDLWRRLVPIYEKEEAKAIVRLLMEDGYGLSLADMLAGEALRLDADDMARLEQQMARLASGEPVQQVLGYAWFCNRRFSVSPDVLTPRPETEELCRWITSSQPCPASSSPHPSVKILDIGTGSGCIACTLALDIPSAHVTALDISSEALAVARSNASALGADVSFVQADILAEDVAPLDTAPLPVTTGFDIIVSNPPYIMQHEQTAMHRNVLDHEPHLALFVPDDQPLLFYNAIARFARRHLLPQGWLYFEGNPLSMAQLAQMLMHEGFTDVETRADNYGRCRMIRARQKN